MSEMRQLRVARGYAKALLRAADEAAVRAETREEVERLLTLMEQSEPFRAFVADTMIPPRRKDEVLVQLFEDVLSPLTRSFLSLLVEKRRERELDDILGEARRQFDEADGVEVAHVRSAVAMADTESQSLAEELSRISGKTVRLDGHVDPELIAGFVVKLGDTVYDASIAAQLERLRATLAGEA